MWRETSNQLSTYRKARASSQISMDACACGFQVRKKCRHLSGEARTGAVAWSGLTLHHHDEVTESHPPQLTCHISRWKGIISPSTWIQKIYGSETCVVWLHLYQDHSPFMGNNASCVSSSLSLCTPVYPIFASKTKNTKVWKTNAHTSISLYEVEKMGCPPFASRCGEL